MRNVSLEEGVYIYPGGKILDAFATFFAPSPEQIFAPAWAECFVPPESPFMQNLNGEGVKSWGVGNAPVAPFTVNATV